MTIGLSHVALGGALMAAAAGIGGFVYGTHVGTAMEQASQKRADDAAEKVRQALQGDIDVSATSHQSAEYDRQANVREIYRETNTITERPVYSSICVDADGVRLLDRSAATANGDGVAEPAGGTGQATVSGAK
ncbi:MAG TPA: hypothetical protein VF503_20350 [Sphingobium sp.]|uniref:hypothetical protein n=1 Tax=Sphingobium sp. TaxID=1912891 RepID=UPI002ED17635